MFYLFTQRTQPSEQVSTETPVKDTEPALPHTNVPKPGMWGRARLTGSRLTCYLSDYEANKQ